MSGSVARSTTSAVRTVAPVVSSNKYQARLAVLQAYKEMLVLTFFLNI